MGAVLGEVDLGLWLHHDEDERGRLHEEVEFSSYFDSDQQVDLSTLTTRDEAYRMYTQTDAGHRYTRGLILVRGAELSKTFCEAWKLAAFARVEKLSEMHDRILQICANLATTRKEAVQVYHASTPFSPASCASIRKAIELMREGVGLHPAGHVPLNQPF